MEENKENKQQEEIKEETKTVENKTEEVKDEKKKTENKTEEIKEKVENKAEEKKEGSFDTEKLKSETTNTVNQVKDTIKNVNIKQDSIETKDFVKNLFVKPVEEIKKVVEDNTGKTFKYAIIIIAIWTIIKLFRLCFSGVFNQSAGAAIWAIVRAIITPALGIIVLAVIMLMLNKEKKKSLTTMITAVTVAQIPVIISALISLINLLSSSAYKITSPISSLCSAISIVLTYFAVKFVFNKKDEEAIKTFVLVEVIYIVVAFILSFIGIYI